MSTGPRLPFQEARALAKRAADVLRPTVRRIKCVGSIRRMRPTCGDIEFVAEPYMNEGLFDAGTPVLDPVRNALLELGTWVRGKDRELVITDALRRPGLRLTVYLVHPPSSWGTLLAIRTGPGELGRYVVTHCKRNGYRIEHGRALTIDRSDVVPTDTEGAFCALANVGCVPPREREAQAIALWNDVGRYDHSNQETHAHEQ